METPLEGIKVLDFTQAVLGPLCTQLLGDLGADVIKVEPLHGDLTRITAMRDADSTVFLACNRSKRSLAINLNMSSGKEIILQMVKDADVVVENFRPGVMKRLGLDFETLSKHNDRLIYMSLSMYGEEGPLARRRGGDPWAQAFTGMVAAQGSPDDPPYLCGHAVIDIGGSLISSTGILSALFMRERTGKGQHITANMVHAGLYMQSSTFCYSLTDNILLKKGGRGTARGQFPYGAYPAKDGDVVTIFGQDDQEWLIVCGILGIEHLLGDARYDTAEKRAERKFELYPILDEAFRKRKRHEWAELFRLSGLRCDPCFDYFELMSQPQFKANDMVVEVEHPVLGQINLLGPPMKFEGIASMKPSLHPPVLGEHTEQVLFQFGYSEREVERLHNKGVIGIAIPEMLKRKEIVRDRSLLVKPASMGQEEQRKQH